MLDIVSRQKALNFPSGAAYSYSNTGYNLAAILVERVDYHYPPYTGFVDRSVDSLGDIRAIEGTRMTVHARANGEIRVADVDFDADGRTDFVVAGRSTVQKFLSTGNWSFQTTMQAVPTIDIVYVCTGDFDGDGRVDLVGSTADALGSTANYLSGYGWRAGEAYGEGTANFAVLAEWNKSEVYRKTIVLYAQKLAGKSK